MKSPCNNKCKAKDGVCVGCRRTLEEISRWRRYSDDEKRAIIDRIQKEGPSS
ncbi:MAG: DUF1289 domain-containing protein [Bacteroidetes bacterium]|nr:DUF1289 domain-containing protein [Bacteroidota bacterium]